MSDERPEGLQQRAENLWESIGGDLCICQRADVWHWCESCQRRIQLIREALGEQSTALARLREQADDVPGRTEAGCAHCHSNDVGGDVSSYCLPCWLEVRAEVARLREALQAITEDDGLWSDGEGWRDDESGFDRARAIARAALSSPSAAENAKI